ncbi:hypothetical protein E4U41_002503 [Claviceps citrina]|nr:hypothetical protein E4U41_002503 [Claviceps citrina]
MANWNAWNPFRRRESHSGGSIVAYKILTLLTWLLSVVVSVYYVLHAPGDGTAVRRRRIWDQINVYPTVFTIEPVGGDMYWLILFVLQLAYVAYLFSRKQEVVHMAASVGSHFVLNNLLHSAFVMLLVRSHFVWAEVMLVANFANLSGLHFRHGTAVPRLVLAAVASVPLAWTFVALYLNGALMVHHPQSLVARNFGNVFVWSILAYGAFFIVAFKDYTMGYALSFLSIAVRVAQLERQIGTDICQISRIYGILSGPPRRRRRFVNRVLAPEEVERHGARLGLLDGGDGVGAAAGELGPRGGGGGDVKKTEMWKLAAFVAGRFAAKEAAIKAHPHRRLTFHDVVIEHAGGLQRLGSGPPVARIKAAAAAGVNDAGDGAGAGAGAGDEDVTALVSISHDGDYATAVCVAHDDARAQGSGVVH